MKMNVRCQYLSLVILLLIINGLSSTINEDYSKSWNSKDNNRKKKASKLPTNIRRSTNSQEREQLYEAYNSLHTLAQEYRKPFDSPAVIVIGHQTSGKSALIEALMGFQFNQVGGGTKTRRPIALRMQYNPSCSSPLCFLTLENGKEEQKSLTDIQSYIESENKRLERDPTRCFDPREINIRMEYKYCPNMIVIDTPGMLHAPKGRQLTPQQRILAHASKEAEDLVLSKIKCQDYIILCVEDTTDWKHATTRNLVALVDQDLARTVLVSTKLDTKIPQFSEPEDLEDYLSAPVIKRMFPSIFGGPFFTSVPSGRVGLNKEYANNELFVHSVQEAEIRDKELIIQKMGRQAKESLPKVGVSQLRSFLEAKVEESYRRNVAKIIPLLQSELRVVESKLVEVEKELNSLSIEKLRERANLYRERFSRTLSNLIQGSVEASAQDWGESLETEQLRGGSFIENDFVHSERWQSILDIEVGNIKNLLYGGAQFRRAMREFITAVRNMKSVLISDDEIANAAGLGDVHDGVNFMRGAAIIAMKKAKESFDPMLEALQHRSVYIMRRLFPIIEDVIRKDTTSDEYSRSFQEMIRNIYEKFVNEQSAICLSKCKDDLVGMTKYVTWDVDGKGGSSALYKSLPTPHKMVEIYKIAFDKKDSVKLKSIQNANQNNDKLKSINSSNKQVDKKKSGKLPVEDKVLDEWTNANNNGQNTNNYNSQRESSEIALDNNDVINDVELSDNYDLLQFMEELLAGHTRTNSLITALVYYIVRCWREYFARAIAMKFNCFFLMPFTDEFPNYLRNELDSLYENGIHEYFDVKDAKLILQSRRNELLNEKEANLKLQHKFDLINIQLSSNSNSNSNDQSNNEFDSNIFDDSSDINIDQSVDNKDDNIDSNSKQVKQSISKINSKSKSNKKTNKNKSTSKQDNLFFYRDDLTGQ